MHYSKTVVYNTQLLVHLILLIFIKLRNNNKKKKKSNNFCVRCCVKTYGSLPSLYDCRTAIVYLCLRLFQVFNPTRAHLRLGLHNYIFQPTRVKRVGKMQRGAPRTEVTVCCINITYAVTQRRRGETRHTTLC